MPLDLSALALASSVLGLLLSLVLGLALRRVPDSDGARLWALALVPMSAGLALGRLPFDTPLLLVLRDPLVLSGHALLLMGLRQSLGLSRKWLLAGAVMLASLVLNAAFTAVWPLPQMREAGRFAGIALLCLACISTLRRLRDAEQRRVRRFLSACFGAVAIASVLQLALPALFLPAAAAGNDVQQMLRELLGAALGLLALGLPVALLLLLCVRMDRVLGGLSKVDPLTGLLNRRGLDEMAATTLTFARRLGRPVGLLLCGLDGLVPGEPGSAAAEETQKAFAVLLQQQFHGAQLAGRVGEGEFVVLLPGADAQQALHAAEALRALALAGPAEAQGPEQEPGAALPVSIGVHCEASPDAAWSAMLGRAAAALREARTRQGACVIADTAAAEPSAGVLGATPA